MYDNENNRQDRVVCRVSTGLVACCGLMLGFLLSWNDYANAEEFATVYIGEIANVNVHADSQPLAVQNLDTSADVDANDKESRPIDSDPDLSDVVQLDTSEGDQNSQLDLAGSQVMRSLDVVDTGYSVEFTNAMGELGGGIEDQKANVDPGDQQPVTGSNDMIDQGGQLEAEKPIHTDADLSDVAQLDTSTGDQYSQLDLAGSHVPSLDVVDTGSSVEFPATVGELGGGIDAQKANDIIEQSDQPLVTDTSVKLPLTNVADAHSQIGDAGSSQLKNVSNDAVSEESAGLPYAVVLALLALIGLVPVARRNDHHHV